MQKRIGERRFMLKVRGLAQQGFQRMSGRQRLERSDQIANLISGGTDPDPSADLRQDVNAGSTVRRVHHEMHRPGGFQDITQSREPRLRGREMMENPGADDLIETFPELT